MAHKSWQDRAAAKVAATAAKIPEHWRISSQDHEKARRQKDLTGPFIESFLFEKEVAIIRLDTVGLVAKLGTRALRCVDVAEAYCKTAAIAHQINNCLHEIFFDQALQRAAELDQYYDEHGKPAGSLHGLPVSLKDQFHVKGIDTTMGYIGWIDTFEGDSDPNKVHKIESQVVSDLLSEGAVVFCKTSLPQTLMCGETINNLIGQTLNPINQGLSCGGSSGGEGALQALRGSSVGLGTDIGGSVRIPAAFCGTYSLKPTHNRLSYRNVANTNPGQLNYPSSVGVMGTSLASLRIVMTALLGTQPWLRDPAVVPMPWRSDIEKETMARVDGKGSATGKSPLRIGLLFNDGFMAPHPPITRGLRMVQSALEKSGHDVVDWDPPSHMDAAQIHLEFLQSDGGYYIHKQLALSGEPLITPLREIFKLRPPVSAITTEELSVQGRTSCEAYSDYWNSKTSADGREVDAFIMPVAPHAAVMPGRYLYTGYTEVVNLLDYCTAVIPVTRADRAVDLVDPGYKPMNDADAKNWAGYDPEAYDGAPVGLQIVCRKYEEEKVCAIARIVSMLIENHT
ncbi:general amidase [Decorospora gaudefroyi]|uniref:General amidase n=1 Tax=Decorospora gaudefroyi TaxID=184978 RepID=A0A6A5K6K4_9PLEO|nr:general amidase [Decorospora gaudefroyi]